MQEKKRFEALVNGLHKVYFTDMAETKSETVVLLHGLIRTKYSMFVLGRKIAAQGYPVLNFGYHSRRHSIEEQALALHGFLQEKLAPKTTINFVTHSLGSIIVRTFALKYHQAYDIHRVVMLGPPNQGSSFAEKLSCSSAFANFMGPAFKELTDLELAPATDKMEIGVIAGARADNRGFSPFLTGANDGIVTREETQLPGLKDSIEYPGMHSLLMYYPQIWKQVIYFLEYGEFLRL